MNTLESIRDWYIWFLIGFAILILANEAIYKPFFA